MKAATVKRGATFKAQLIFDAEEWAEIYPWEEITAEVGQGGRRYPLAVSVAASQRTITVTAAPASTRLWLTEETGRTGVAAFDVWITKDGARLPIPASSNIPLKIIEGVGR
ncbi:hypothetical protein QWZ10_10500 [Paracoccus cavernae]|uniref:Uncharacterized protein n=2 Tax=Paracoccus cavernae TaxID=1571207 RepID=A0ABT8D9K6_9RHOB|nr:hypothetical protein [Paracoccus cavernae]